MPFVLKHKGTDQIYSCKLINVYDLEYYGIKNWEDRAEAEAERESFLTRQGASQVGEWEVLEVEEHLLKMLNVKLNNNAGKRVYINEQGKAEARPASEGNDDHDLR